MAISRDKSNLVPIPGELHSTATGNRVAGADEIYDYRLQKNQEDINKEFEDNELIIASTLTDHNNRLKAIEQRSLVDESTLEEDEDIIAEALGDLAGKIRNNHTLWLMKSEMDDEADNIIIEGLVDLNAKIKSAVSMIRALDDKVENNSGDFEEAEAIISSSLVDLDQRSTALETEIVKKALNTDLQEDEDILAEALTDLNSKLRTINSNFGTWSVQDEEDTNTIIEALVDLNTRAKDNRASIQTVFNALLDLQSGSENSELIISSSLTQLDGRISDLETDITKKFDIVDNNDNEDIIAEAITDLNTKIKTVNNKFNTWSVQDEGDTNTIIESIVQLHSEVQTLRSNLQTVYVLLTTKFEDIYTEVASHEPHGE